METPITLSDDFDYGEAPEGVSPEVWESWKKWKMKPPDDFIFQVRRGIEGRNAGLRNGLENVNKYIHGTHQARYYLVGADAGVGKTTVTDFMYIFKAWEDAKRQGRKIKIFYCSFEIGKLDKVARWVSHYVFMKFNVRLPSDYILGRIEGKLVTPEHEKMIMVAYTIVLEMLYDKDTNPTGSVIFVGDVIHPTKIFEDLIEAHFEHQGKVKRAELTEEQKKKHRKGYVIGYEANDPDAVTILFIDTLNLTGSEQGLDTKHIMDRMSRYAIVLRNMFHCTCVFIQQFSTDLMSWHRSNKKNPDAIAPQRIDFGDSKATYRDADVVIGLIKPSALDFDTFKGYILLSKDETEDIAPLKDYFVAMYLMKNRYGAANRCLPIFLDPIAGCVYDLPLTPNNPFAMKPWHERAAQLNKVITEYS